jgi:hypothetical protein
MLFSKQIPYKMIIYTTKKYAEQVGTNCNTSNLYSGATQFESRKGQWQSRLMLFVVLSVPPSKFQNGISIRHRQCPYKSFTIHPSFTNNRYSDWLDDRGIGVQVPVGPRIFSSSRHTNRLWAHYPMGSGGSFSGGYSGRDMRLTTHHQPVPRSRKCGSIHPLPHTPSRRSA